MEVRLIDVLGDDLRVVNAARVSFGKESQWVIDYEKSYKESGVIVDPYVTISEKDQKLISYLAKHNHWTPFSHVQITMVEKLPIFVARQRFKHMVGFTYNEVSRRYVDDSPEFYTPDSWRKRADNKKQGSSDEEITDLRYQGFNIQTVSDAYDKLLMHVDILYKDMIEAGVAPEQARMVLPQSMYTEYYVTGSLAAWARAYRLRSDLHSQLEIQNLAAQWDKIISNIPELKYSWQALRG